VSKAILVLNTGSSSIKFALFPADREPERSALLCEGECEGIGHNAMLHARSRTKGVFQAALGEGADHAAALTALLQWIESRFGDYQLAAAGHRVVHGGAKYCAPILIDDAVMAELTQLVPLAPLHQPHNLRAIAALKRLHPKLPQIACFDTAFHHGQPAIATSFALPWQLTAEGVRRYGFHGLSYEFIASVLPEHLGAAQAEGRVIVAHLGNGASLCAMRGRESQATTMGFTALDGLPMGERCGALDPGVVLYLMQEKGLSPAAVSDLLYHRSGLLGVSGLSNDMRTLLTSQAPRAREAIDLFVYRIGRELGSLAAALGGLDAVVFTAGIGEHAAEIRRRVCEDAAWLGVVLDEQRNAMGEACISKPHSAVSVWVIPTDEDLVIARHTWERLI